MQNAARDLGRLSRLIAGSAGAAVALVGAAALLMSHRGEPPDGLLADPAAALVPAGLALLQGALPVADRTAGRVVHGTAALLFLFSAAICGATLSAQPAAALVILVALAALVLLGRTLSRLHDASPPQSELVAELRGENVRLREEAARSRTESSRLREEADRARDDNARQEAENARLREADAGARQEADRLREAHGKLEAALTFKNDLTSMLTHDVAQPISSIASLAELLRADWDDLPDDIRLELATKIDKNTQRLIKMMNDLQLLFRLDTGSITARRNPVPLKEIAEAVSATASGDVRVEIGENLSVLADRGHVQVMLRNLVTNAIAYGDTPVVVSAARHGDHVEVAVRDNGPGISDDLLPTLFGRFARGAGLGLFIVRHLAEANGGSVRYEHATPRGACLIVTLEAAPV